MRHLKVGVLVVIAGACLALSGGSALAQTNATLTGQVTDATGGVLPGVTVEAGSPALIEGTRVVLTDGQGRYRIIDLRPGTYTLTFALMGFSTVVREDLSSTAAWSRRWSHRVRRECDDGYTTRAFRPTKT